MATSVARGAACSARKRGQAGISTLGFVLLLAVVALVVIIAVPGPSASSGPVGRVYQGIRGEVFGLTGGITAVARDAGSLIGLSEYGMASQAGGGTGGPAGVGKSVNGMWGGR